MASVKKVGVVTLCCKEHCFCHVISFNSFLSLLLLSDAVEHGALLNTL